MATKANIEIIRGEDKIIEDTVAGTGDIIGWSLAFAVARGYGETSAFTKTTGAGITVTNGPGRVFQIVIDDTDTDSLDPGGYVWDVKRSDAGSEAVLTYGELDLKPNVAV